MESKKLELIEKMEQKGFTIPEAAEKIEFDPQLLELYLAKDTYPVPKRILEKLAGAVNG